MDYFIPKKQDYWVFPVYFLGEGKFTDNILSIFNQVKNDSNIKKIILRREKNIRINGENVIVVKINSLQSIYYLMRSGVIILQHSLAYEFRDSLLRIKFYNKRKIINLWHGIGIKDISNKDIGIMNEELLKESPYHFICTSSETDKRNMMKAFYLTSEDRFLITGLPRNDFLLFDEKNLLAEIQDDLVRIRKRLNGKRLISYMPTYRDYRKDGYYYNFNLDEIEKLTSFLVNNNSVLGFRYHPYNQPMELIEKLKTTDVFFNLNDFENTAAIMRESSVIITDYSSSFVDALYVDKEKRTICFAYDYDDYLENQHGLFYDLKSIFLKPICVNFDQLMQALMDVDKPYSLEELDRIQDIRTIFFRYIDVQNSQRVVDKVKELIAD